MRLLTGMLVGQNISARLIGNSDLDRRPMTKLIAALQEMGGNLKEVWEDEKRQIVIGQHKGLRALHYYNESGSAQIKSALLLAAHCGGVTATIEEPAPTRDHTERWIEYCIKSPLIPLLQRGRTMEGEIPGDISSAAFFIALAALSKDRPLTIHNVALNSTRLGFLRTLQRMGAEIRITHETFWGPEPVGKITVLPSKLKGVVVPSSEIPSMIDEIPILAVASLFAEGTTVIPSLGPLRGKESDRLQALATELQKCGARLTLEKETLQIQGKTKLHPANFNTYGDHRLAMSFTILGLLIPGTSPADPSDCVSKSLPNFYNILENNLFL